MKNKQKQWRTDARNINKITGHKHSGRANRAFQNLGKATGYPLLNALLARASKI